MNICISIVSHNQLKLVHGLLLDLTRSFQDCDHSFTVILTHNFGDQLITDDFGFDFLQINNLKIQGFGQNHNQAFKFVDCDQFIVLNPDIRLEPFFDWDHLLLNANDGVGVFSASITDDAGKVQDNARRYPTPLNIGRRICYRLIGKSIKPDYIVSDSRVMNVDWVGGMFMVFNKHAFRSVMGFDEKYFMYGEDADICYRLNTKGYKVCYAFCNGVIHNAQYGSRKNIKYFRWHVLSIIRFFLRLTIGNILYYLRVRKSKKK